MYCTAKYFKMFDDNNKRTLFSGPAKVASIIFAVFAIVVSKTSRIPFFRSGIVSAREGRLPHRNVSSM